MIEFLNVFKYYKKHWPVLEDVNLKIESGEFVFLTGPSGAGKTTILHHIYMKELPTSGQVIVDGTNSMNIRKRDIPVLRRKVGMVFQEALLLHDRNVFENVALPLRLSGFSAADIKKRTLKILAYTGLSHKMNEMTRYLSSGEKQRICIARALVNDPIVLLADEPTGNLDAQNADEVFGVLRNINAQGTAVVMATHQLSFIEKKPFRRIHIVQGRIAG
jgi:cell division transport system ATP-binding protein